MHLKFGQKKSAAPSALGLLQTQKQVMSFPVVETVGRCAGLWLVAVNEAGQELGNKLLQSVKEMQAGKAARVTQIAANEVAAARLKTGLSQILFAQALQISPRTLQEWEQGRRKPSGAAKALIQCFGKTKFRQDVLT